jgi:hypothetical protein
MKVATQTVTIRPHAPIERTWSPGEVAVDAVADETREAPRRRSPRSVAILVVREP